MTAEKPQDSQSFGYLFEYMKTPQGIEWVRQITIRLQGITNMHYDPEMIRLPTINSTGLKMLNLRRGFREDDSVVVVPGTVTVTDRKNKALSFFTFGGSCTIKEFGTKNPELHQNGQMLQQKNLELAVTGKSGTPILSKEIPWQNTIADFAEIWLARRRAECLRNKTPSKYLDLLDDETLYPQILEEILAAKYNPEYLKLRAIIRREIARFQ
jgi:hypothetical protein